MADEKLTYLIDGSGDVVSATPEDAMDLRAAGYFPASEKQAEEFQKEQAFHEKYSTAGQRLKTFGESGAGALTFGASTWLEKELGVSPEDIKAREEENPKTHIAGTLAGVALPLILSAGASAPEAGAVLAGEGVAEAASVARGALGAAKAASRFSAPSLIAKAGEGVAGLLPEAAEATTAAGRVGLKALHGAVSAGTEGGLYGLAHVVHEAGLGDPNLTWQSAAEEVGLSGLLGFGVGGSLGALGGLTREAVGGRAGEQLAEKAHEFEAQRLGKQTGVIQGGIAKLEKRLGKEGFNKLMREAGETRTEAGERLIGMMDTAGPIARKSSEILDETAPKISGFLKSADSVGAAPRAMADISERAQKEILGPLMDNPTARPAADAFATTLGGYEKLIAENGGATFERLQAVRKQLDDAIYGLRGDKIPGGTDLSKAYHDLRTMLNDEIDSGLEKSGLNSKDFQALRRRYQVAATVNDMAEKGLTRAIGNNPVPLTSLMSGLTGLISGGPIGALGLGTAAFLARKYGSGVMAAGARGMRRFIDAGAEESIINKTADLVASERAVNAAAAGAKLAHAFDRAAETLEPLGAPVKDASREALKERVANRIESSASSEPETVAALSQFGKANKQVQDRVDKLAGSLVSGKRLARSEAAAIAAHESRGHGDFAAEMQQVRQLANNPELMQKYIAAAIGDVHEHAPAVAQAAAIHMAKSINHLNTTFPAKPKMGPLGPVLRESKSEAFKYKKVKSAIDRPSVLMRHAILGTLTQEQVDAVKATAPERLAQMQKAILDKVTEHPHSVPYAARMAMRMLMGQDMDGTAAQQAIASSQAIYKMPSAKNGENSTGPGAMKSTQTGLSKLKVSNRMMTPGQGAESRRDV